jgi:hypothetical protein
MNIAGTAVENAVLFNLPNFFKIVLSLYMLCVSDYRHTVYYGFSHKYDVDYI